MSNIIKKTYNRIYGRLTHAIGRLTKKYYYEDYIRVYPDGITFQRSGKPRRATKDDMLNFLNHCKNYRFASQFVGGKYVADCGCGSGFGSEILKEAGAVRVCGSDMSVHGINFAKSRFSHAAEFTVGGITDMKTYADDLFDISVSFEVIEHVKEYGMEKKAVREMKRITKPGGLIIVTTPNAEMLEGHGFLFQELHDLFSKNFQRYCIFENALVPFGDGRAAWDKRVSDGMTGVVISQKINLSETVLPEGVHCELKKGIEAGIFQFEGYDINTGLLHNTHSWLIMAVNGK